jgi:hypothetical protein
MDGQLCENNDGYPPVASYADYEPPITQFINNRTLVVTTPKYIEIGTTILINRDGLGFSCSDANDTALGYYPGNLCKPAFTFKTLAFTANQGASGPGSQSVGIVDTAANTPFAARASMALDPAVVPLGMDYVRGGRAGRTLLVVDLREGQVWVHDAANFTDGRKLAVQGEADLPYLHNNIGAVDVTAGADGTYAYVIHMTHGGPKKYHAEPVNYFGSVSVLKFQDDGRAPGCPGGVYPCVLDIDGDAGTTSGGAPAGISRIEPPPDWWFMPLAGEDVYVPRAEADYRVGDRYPGEYLFLSGFGPAEWGWVPDPHCRPGQHCPPIRILLPRPVQVAIVDLNPWIVESVDPLIRRPNCKYRTFLDIVDFGSQGGWVSDQGLGFNPASTADGIHLYAVNPHQDMVADLRFTPARLPIPPDPAADPTCSVMGPTQPPLEVLAAYPTGPTPTDVKVQFVDPYTYAYITNAGDDTVTVMDTANNMEAFDSPISTDVCFNDDNYPTSFDTRGVGDFGYSSNFTSGTVSVINLPGNSCTVPPLSPVV